MKALSVILALLPGIAGAALINPTNLAPGINPVTLQGTQTVTGIVGVSQTMTGYSPVNVSGILAVSQTLTGFSPLNVSGFITSTITGGYIYARQDTIPWTTTSGGYSWAYGDYNHPIYLSYTVNGQSLPVHVTSSATFIEVWQGAEIWDVGNSPQAPLWTSGTVTGTVAISATPTNFAPLPVVASPQNNSSWVIAGDGNLLGVATAVTSTIMSTSPNFQAGAGASKWLFSVNPGTARWGHASNTSAWGSLVGGVPATYGTGSQPVGMGIYPNIVNPDGAVMNATTQQVGLLGTISAPYILVGNSDTITLSRFHRQSGTPSSDSTGSGKRTPADVGVIGSCTPLSGSIVISPTTGTTKTFDAAIYHLEMHVSGDSGATAYAYSSFVSCQDAAADNGDSFGYTTYGQGAGTYPIQELPNPYTNMNTAAFTMYFATKGGNAVTIHWAATKVR